MFMRKVCFYCPEDIFQVGGGSVVALNILKDFDNGMLNYIVFSNNTNVPCFIKKKYKVLKLWYPSSTWGRALFDMFIAPILLLPYFRCRVICLNSIVPLLYPFRLEVFFQMRMFYYEELDSISKRIKNVLGILSIKRSKNVFVASENHKKDLVSYLSVPSSKIKVALLGFNFDYKLDDLKSCALNKNPYWLFISVFRPYKNIDGLIDAYGKLYMENSLIPDLILIGDYPAGYLGIESYKSKIESLINQYDLDGKVCFLGFQSHEISMNYLANAELFIFPSKFEGFGLPILEAMALGIPVLSSNTHSLPEIGADTIDYFSPDIEGDLFDHLSKIYYRGYSFDTLKAQERSREFSWKSTCDVIAEA